MVGTIVGLVVGVLATIFVSRYYFVRTTRKSLAVYRMVNTQVFAGIEPEVRNQLKFTYREREVTNLLQLQYIIANDGERAIRDVIEPLRLDLPKDACLLDATVLHQHPKDLQASIQIKEHGETRSLLFNFPLLNKGDFFLVKLLISGKVDTKSLAFKIVADDLPRSISPEWLSAGAFEERKYHPEWGMGFAGLVFMGLATWLSWLLALIREHHREMFPIPWDTFNLSVSSAALLLPSVLILLVIGLVGIFLFGAAVFGGEFPPSRQHFPIPAELRRRTRIAFREGAVPDSFLEELNQESHATSQTITKTSDGQTVVHRSS